MYEAIPCRCGDPTCKSYQVRGIALEAKFDRVQALAVAKLLNKIAARRPTGVKLIRLQFSLEEPRS